jgi:hypothetical protein
MENPLPAPPHRGNLGLLVKGVVLYLALSPHLMLMVADSVINCRTEVCVTSERRSFDGYRR